MASDVLIMAEELSRNRERLNEIYAHHTGQTVEKIAETLDRFFLIFKFFEGKIKFKGSLYEC